MTDGITVLKFHGNEQEITFLNVLYVKGCMGKF